MALFDIFKKKKTEPAAEQNTQPQEHSVEEAPQTTSDKSQQEEIDE